MHAPQPMGFPLAPPDLKARLKDENLNIDTWDFLQLFVSFRVRVQFLVHQSLWLEQPERRTVMGRETQQPILPQVILTES